jgi:GrpB-like predicted nucleotidyltransferase (UPF0157 family)
VDDRIVIVDYDPSWPEQFRQLGARLREALGPFAMRIDHIGSTSVVGLAAKPIVDIQISVASLEPVSAYLPALKAAGFRWRADNPERTKRYFREVAGPRTHIHVRAAGSWSEQFALLMRDYLRDHPEEAARYAALKREFADHLGYDRHAYTDAKDPFIWALMARANTWTQATGWMPGPSDC